MSPISDIYAWHADASHFWPHHRSSAKDHLSRVSLSRAKSLKEAGQSVELSGRGRKINDFAAKLPMDKMPHSAIVDEHASNNQIYLALLEKFILPS